MEKSAIYHRPESEYAYAYDKETFHIRLRTKKNDLCQVMLYYGDPFWNQEVKAMKSMTMDLILSTDIFDYYQVELRGHPKRLQYGFRLEGHDGSLVWYGDLGLFDLEAGQLLMRESEHYFKMPYIHETDMFQAPEWVQNRVWYQIFPDRFNKSGKGNHRLDLSQWNPKASPGFEDYYGGDLPGIIAKLDYLEDLGINGIYLCPIFKAGSNHKYDTYDYYEIDPDFGTKEDLKALVHLAHQKGIRIILDGVFNHIGLASKQWQDVLSKGSKSDYYAWFHIHQEPVTEFFPIDDQTYNYESFAFVKAMPKLNTSQAQVQDFILDVASYWIKECDIDGWRLDVANEVDHQFWKLFHRRLKELKSDIYIMGEVWHKSQAWLTGDEFHSVMNYPLKVLIHELLIHQTRPIEETISNLRALQMDYRQSTNQVLFNLLDSHDTARLLHMCGGNKDLVKLSLVFLFLQYGTPCLYYGTEIGLDGGPDPDCRRPMAWQVQDQDLDMLAFTKALIMFRKDKNSLINFGRKQIQVLSQSIIKLVSISDEGKLVAYFNIGQEAEQLDLVQVRPLLANNYQANSQSLMAYGFVIVNEREN